MSRMTIDLAPPTGSSSVPTSRARTCAFGANCNCVFAPNPSAVGDSHSPAAADSDDLLTAEIVKLTDLGWQVTDRQASEATLERRLGMAFCLNVLLCLVTGFLWLGYWIPRSRRPRFDVRRVTVAADGTVTATRIVEHRRAGGSQDDLVGDTGLEPMTSSV